MAVIAIIIITSSWDQLWSVLDLEGVQEPFGSHEISIKAIYIHFSVLYNKLGRSPKLPQLDLTLVMVS